jgi:hypothetical protein
MDLKIKAIIFVVFVLVTNGTSSAETKSVERINLFKDVVEAAGAAGSALENITDGIEHLIITSAKTWDILNAKIQRNRLVDISARSTSLVVHKNAFIIGNIDKYLELKKPSIIEWNNFKINVRSVMLDVNELLSDVNDERSDFILNENYAKLSGSLVGRMSLLSKIDRLPMPTSQEELEQIKLFNEKYKILMFNMTTAIEHLNEYIKTLN